MEAGVRLEDAGDFQYWLILVFIFVPFLAIFAFWVYLDGSSDDAPSGRVETADSRKEGRKAFRQMLSYLRKAPLVRCAQELLPPSCEWAGSYRNDGCNSRKENTKAKVTFEVDGTFRGSGTDGVRDFEILGKFDIKQGRFVWLESCSSLGQLDPSLSFQQQLEKRIKQLSGSAAEQGRLQSICDAQLYKEKGWLLHGRFCSNKGSTGPIERFIMEKVTVLGDDAYR